MSSADLPTPAARRAPVAFISGAVIGALGGLIGLGGAEFRLPLLIGAFRFAALQAVILNKAMSLVVVASALLRPQRDRAIAVSRQARAPGGMTSSALSSWLVRHENDRSRRRRPHRAAPRRAETARRQAGLGLARRPGRQGRLAGRTFPGCIGRT